MNFTHSFPRRRNLQNCCCTETPSGYVLVRCCSAFGGQKINMHMYMIYTVWCSCRIKFKHAKSFCYWLRQLNLRFSFRGNVWHDSLDKGISFKLMFVMLIVGLTIIKYEQGKESYALCKLCGFWDIPVITFLCDWRVIRVRDVFLATH